MVQAQAATLATLADAVAKLDQSFIGLNTTMALLLEKVTHLTDEKKKPPRNAEALQRPASPTPPADKRERPDNSADADEDEISQPTGAQWVRSTQ